MTLAELIDVLQTIYDTCGDMPVEMVDGEPVKLAMVGDGPVCYITDRDSTDE